MLEYIELDRAGPKIEQQKGVNEIRLSQEVIIRSVRSAQMKYMILGLLP